MLRNWKLFGVTTLMVFALTAPASAGDKDGPPQDDKIKALESKIDTLIKSIQGSFADAKSDANLIREELKSLKTETNLRFQVAVSRIDALDRQIAQLKLDLDTVKNGGIKAYYPPDTKDKWSELKAELTELRQLIVAKSSPNPPTVTTATLGELMVVNRYPEEITLRVNGADQGRIPANSSMFVKALPVGPVTYEIISPTWGSSGIRRSTIVPGDPLRVNVQ